MLDNININSLKCFIKVAEAKSISRAAEELYITQPTLSRKLSKLEGEIGRTLFRRTSKGIELTPDGLIFFEQSKRLIASIDDLANNQLVEKTIVGNLNVGYQRPTMDFIMDFNSKFVAAYPQVNLGIIKLGRQNVVDELLFGDLDLSLIYEHELRNYKKAINHIHVGSCKMAVMVSHNHPLAGRSVIHLSELYNDKFILLDRNIAPVKIAELYEHCNANGFVPNVLRVEKDHLDIVTDIVTYNAVSLAPVSRRGHSADGPVDEPIRYIDLDGFDTNYPICLAWPAANANPLLPLYVHLAQTVIDENQYC